MDWTITSEHRSTHHLLTQAPALARKFDPDAQLTSDGGIDWPRLEAVCHSSSERLLARAARDLWNGSGDAPLRDLLVVLDRANFGALVDAMQMRRQWTGTDTSSSPPAVIRDGTREP